MPFPAVPGVEQIGKTVIDQTRNLTNDWQANEPAEPGISRRISPNCDGAIGADMEPIVGIDCVQAAAHVLKPGAEARQRIRLEIDVAELDDAGAGGAGQAAALEVDAGVTDRTFGVVINDKLA
jgi:hypothetical protein